MDHGVMRIQNIRQSFLIGEICAVWWEQYQVRARHEPSGVDTFDGDMTIEALPTWYGGTTFRSRLEADWAATLDSLAVRWQYEPETVTLPSGTKYIPDFWLPELGTWIEVKGTGVPRVEKAIELGESRACRCEAHCGCEWPRGELVLIGHPPRPYDPWANPDNDGVPYQILRNWAWRHGGHPNWSSAHGRPAWLSRCRSCRRAAWFVSGPWCRACGNRLAGVHAYASGDIDLEFVSSACRPAPGQSANNGEVAA